MKPLLALCALVILALPLAACGAAPEEDAVAMERNTFELDGLDYRVVLFRQLNPRSAPDRALYDGLPTEGNTGLFAAFIETCNESGEPRTPTSQVRLEDAFGEAYPRVAVPAGSPLGYRAEPVQAERCFPADDAVADQALPGAAVVFKVPLDALTNRPFVLEFRDPDGGAAEVRRVELDL